MQSMFNQNKTKKKREREKERERNKTSKIIAAEMLKNEKFKLTSYVWK